ncbi:hypothetical protein LJK88_19005 [Paenibacillus sp. P26]|nr:hypothetical protein LJK88_19005 [Paenibacillus sp. P26]
MPVLALSDVKAITAGNNHALALKNDGSVYTFGLNNFGQLGRGSLENSAVITKVTGLDQAEAIGSGLFHSFAVRSDGSVMAWGNNTMGQLGDGTTTNRTSPVALPKFNMKAPLRIREAAHRPGCRGRPGV